jgi:predicted GNAT family acetyltransferase
VVPEHEGHGYGTRMVQDALDDTRSAGLHPVGRCSMVRHFLEEHPEYAR